MYKMIQYSSHIEKNGKLYRTIYPVYPGNGLFRKIAEASDLDPELQAFVSNLKSDPNKIFVVAVAMGAGESWSSNVNGDWFGREDLIKKHHTFKKNGKVFHLHDNTAHSKSYGEILFSRYNKLMDRVELVFSIDRNEMPDVVKDIEDGNTVDVSMGTKVAFDVCSICNKQSKRFSDYCQHLKYEMNKIYPDGRKVYALNPDPNFFDISIVDTGADRTAKILAKVASEHRIIHSAALAEKLSINKENMLDKGDDTDISVEKALPEKLKLYWEHLGKSVDDNCNDLDLREFPGSFGIGDILGLLTDNNILARPHEFASLLADRSGMKSISDDIFSNREVLSSDGDDSKASPMELIRSGNLPGGIPGKYTVERSMSPGRMAMRFRLMAGGVSKEASFKKQYLVKSARSAFERQISLMYQNYIKTASKRILKKTAQELVDVLPRLFAAILIGKSLLENPPEANEKNKLQNLSNSINNSSDDLKLGPTNIMGVDMDSLAGELNQTKNMTSFDIMRAAKQQADELDKMLNRSGNSNTMTELNKTSRMCLSQTHILANCFNLVKLSSGMPDNNISKVISTLSPVANVVSLAFNTPVLNFK